LNECNKFVDRLFNGLNALKLISIGQTIDNLMN